MITYNEIERLTDGLIDIYQGIEDDLITNVASMLDYRFTPEGADIVEWQLRKLQQMGALRQENIRAIAVAAGKTERQITEIISEAGFKGVAADDTIYSWALERGALSNAAIPARYSLPLRNIVDAAVSNARDYFNLVNTTALESAQDGFMRIVNKSYLEVSMGVKDYRTAVRDAVKQLAEQGITGMTYEISPGRFRRDRVDVAARRAILTSSAQTAGKMQLQRAAEWDSNLVEVSSHIGARPSHAEWQGRVYSIRGDAPDYPNLERETGYGTAGGLLGVNCRHVFYPFFEGYSEQRYTPYDQEYNDQVYAESQQQRAIEREIRANRRQVVAMGALGDTDAKAAAQVKVDAAKDKMESFIAQTGRTRRREREVT